MGKDAGNKIDPFTQLWIELVRDVQVLIRNDNRGYDVLGEAANLSPATVMYLAIKPRRNPHIETIYRLCGVVQGGKGAWAAAQGKLAAVAKKGTVKSAVPAKLDKLLERSQ